MVVVVVVVVVGASRLLVKLAMNDVTRWRALILTAAAASGLEDKRTDQCRGSWRLEVVEEKPGIRRRRGRGRVVEEICTVRPSTQRAHLDPTWTLPCFCSNQDGRSAIIRRVSIMRQRPVCGGGVLGEYSNVQRDEGGRWSTLETPPKNKGRRRG